MLAGFCYSDVLPKRLLVGFSLPDFSFGIIQGSILNHPDKPILSIVGTGKNHIFFVEAEKSFLAEIFGSFFASRYAVGHPEQNGEHRLIEFTEFLHLLFILPCRLPGRLVAHN
jgi:hypothetical protein